MTLKQRLQVRRAGRIAEGLLNMFSYLFIGLTLGYLTGLTIILIKVSL
jgi:hypothetical protein